MSPLLLDPYWLAALNARADQPPLQTRVPLALREHVIGSVEPDYLQPLLEAASSPVRGLLQRDDSPTGPCWRILGEGSAALQRLAQALYDARIGNVVAQWRNEPLAVRDAAGRELATVERGVVRPLGIATRAVHLVGRGSGGRYWVQQRALDKPNDPGLWDTLMGGMVSAADNVASALERETWEEAGIRLNALQGLARGGQVAMRKPSTEPLSAGYVVEQLEWFSATLPGELVPENRDGEVAQFALLEPRELLQRLYRNEFTTEAALILVAALQSA
ncbi:MAG: NUDIX domain-containing protein [Betaproteobacteria bacterium]